MKKLLGLMAVISLVACSESSDPLPTANDFNNNNSGVSNTPAATITDMQGNTLVYDAMHELYYNQVTQQFYSDVLKAYVDPVTKLPLQSSSSVAPLPVSSSTLVDPLSSSVVAPIGVPSSSSVAPVVQSSSSVAPVVKSSSSVAPKSSSAKKPAGDGSFSITTWDGSALDPHVLTGDETGGWWYDYANDGSEVTWGAEVGTDGDKTAVVETCGGICGSYTIGGDDEYPYLGVAFDYDKSGSAEDASAMKGVCVVYSFTGDNDFALELGMTTAQENSLGSALPMATLPSGTKKTMDFAWADFEQPSWATKVMTGTNAAKQLKSLKFKVVDPAAGDEGTFTIFKVGPKGSCN